MTLRNAARRSGWLALALGVTTPACLEPTEAIVDISTNAECSAVSGTGITAGKEGKVELAGYDTTTAQCQGEGEIGSIVLLPDGDPEGAFAFKVVTSLGTTPIEACIPPLYGPSCVVARRSMSFVPHLPFHVPVKMNLACAGVLCPEEQTCVEGTCVSPALDCDDPDGCEPEPDIPPPWEKQLGGPGSQMARHVARGSDGIVAVTGNFTGTIDLGQGPLESAGSHDMFLATYAPTGLFRWALRFGGSGDDEGISLAIGPHGDVHMLGVFESTVAFGEGKIKSKGEWDLALVKVASFGKLAWAVGLGGEGLDAGGKVAVDADGNVYVAGSFTGAATIAGTKLTSAGSSDGFLASFNSAGQLRWVKALGGADTDAASSVAVDDAGHVYVGGLFHGQMDLGSGPLVSVGGGDAFLASFDSEGALRWSKSFGSAGQDLVGDLAARGERVVCTGVLAGMGTIDGVPQLVTDQDGFVASFDVDGKLQWTKVFGTEGGDQGTTLDIGADERIVLGGSVFRGPVFKGPVITGPGYRSPFLAVFEPDGKLVWSRQLESTLAADVTGVAASPDGYAYFAGWFTDKLTYDGQVYTSKDAEDALLLRIAPP